ncbi:hypothetical protein XELAEV_18043992mg [Xenopus laevis]|uniref:Uncharacterized protein n=1 Tax=Xenopus laevis TaxID=8355 RepID=A0A974BY87_XENLA|nr:hypothetical protein XELAEV_18043992mg [Xenopus laevis]
MGPKCFPIILYISYISRNCHDIISFYYYTSFNSAVICSVTFEVQIFIYFNVLIVQEVLFTLPPMSFFISSTVTGLLSQLKYSLLLCLTCYKFSQVMILRK